MSSSSFFPSSSSQSSPSTAIKTQEEIACDAYKVDYNQLSRLITCITSEFHALDSSHPLLTTTAKKRLNDITTLYDEGIRLYEKFKDDMVERYQRFENEHDSHASLLSKLYSVTYGIYAELNRRIMTRFEHSNPEINTGTEILEMLAEIETLQETPIKDILYAKPVTDGVLYIAQGMETCAKITKKELNTTTDITTFDNVKSLKYKILEITAKRGHTTGDMVSDDIKSNIRMFFDLISYNLEKISDAKDKCHQEYQDIKSKMDEINVNNKFDRFLAQQERITLAALARLLSGDTVHDRDIKKWMQQLEAILQSNATCLVELQKLTSWIPNIQIDPNATHPEDFINTMAVATGKMGNLVRNYKKATTELLKSKRLAPESIDRLLECFNILMKEEFISDELKQMAIKALEPFIYIQYSKKDNPFIFLKTQRQNAVAAWYFSPNAKPIQDIRNGTLDATSSSSKADAAPDVAQTIDLEYKRVHSKLIDLYRNIKDLQQLIQNTDPSVAAHEKFAAFIRNLKGNAPFKLKLELYESQYLNTNTAIKEILSDSVFDFSDYKNAELVQRMRAKLEPLKKSIYQIQETMLISLRHFNTELESIEAARNSFATNPILVQLDNIVANMKEYAPPKSEEYQFFHDEFNLICQIPDIGPIQKIERINKILKHYHSYVSKTLTDRSEERFDALFKQMATDIFSIKDHKLLCHHPALLALDKAILCLVEQESSLIEMCDAQTNDCNALINGELKNLHADARILLAKETANLEQINRLRETSKKVLLELQFIASRQEAMMCNHVHLDNSTHPFYALSENIWNCNGKLSAIRITISNIYEKILMSHQVSLSEAEQYEKHFREEFKKANTLLEELTFHITKLSQQEPVMFEELYAHIRTVVTDELDYCHHLNKTAPRFIHEMRFHIDSLNRILKQNDSFFSYSPIQYIQQILRSLDHDNTNYPDYHTKDLYHLFKKLAMTSIEGKLNIQMLAEFNKDLSLHGNMTKNAFTKSVLLAAQPAELEKLYKAIVAVTVSELAFWNTQNGKFKLEIQDNKGRHSYTLPHRVYQVTHAVISIQKQEKRDGKMQPDLKIRQILGKTTSDFKHGFFSKAPSYSFDRTAETSKLYDLLAELSKANLAVATNVEYYLLKLNELKVEMNSSPLYQQAKMSAKS